MLLVGFLSWWYGDGWRDQVSRIGRSLSSLNDFFSIPLLVRTLFAPFRQISAGETGKDINSKFKAWGDRTVSRVIGAFMRTFMITFGSIAMLFVLALSLVRVLLWPMVPFFPIIGSILMISVGTPWKIV